MTFEAASHSAVQPKPRPPIPGVLEHAWEGLLRDSGALVMVIREDGILVEANAAMLAWAGKTEALAIGRPAAELLPPGLVEERTRLYAQCIMEQKSLVVEGMIGGSLVRCSLRPVPPHGADGPAHLLCISRRIGPDAEPCPEPRYRALCDDKGLMGTLTERETEVLTLIGQGMTTAQIAKALHRSVKTIEWHRVALGSKLNVANRVELARLAIQFGLASANGAQPEPTDQSTFVGSPK